MIRSKEARDLMKRISFVILSMMLLIIVFSGCGNNEEEVATEMSSVSDTQTTAPVDEKAYKQKTAEPADKEDEITPGSAKTIVIDPGHSSVVSGEMEPLGPGSVEMKAADSIGTQGVSTGVPEYELTLEVSQKLQSELTARGYNVLLTRNTNDIALSCAERAAIANENAADVFLRIHANGSEDQTVQGAMTICITPQNPFYPALYSQSRALSDEILQALCSETGCENEGVWETDTMSGNNWSQVPATIVEMGYMTNPEEDLQLISEEYQDKIVQGIADGLDAYMILD